MFVLLDIDGVMVPAKSWESPELLSDGFYKFSERATRVLQNIISDDTTIILTTSHKSRYSIEEWKNIFRFRGIMVDNLDKLEDNIFNKNRVEEVLGWFAMNKPSENLIILDDDQRLQSLPPFLRDKLILTNAMIGLVDAHVDEIKLKLGTQCQFV